MPWPTDRNRDLADEVALTFNGQVKQLRFTAQAIRDRSAVQQPINSRDVRELFQLLASTRRYGEAKIGTPGLATAYRRLFLEFGTFDPAAEWPALRTAIDNLLTWLKGAVPKDGNGGFALERPDANNELGAFDIALTNPQYSAVTTRLDALLLAID